MQHRHLYVIKLGSSFPEIVAEYGDFDTWTAKACRAPQSRIQVIDAEHGQELPPPQMCAGVVLTGSHSMVTDRLPWSEHTTDWLRTLLYAEVPILGICYGHQLLAHAAGGTVGYLPSHIEIGTAQVCLRHTESSGDPLFADLPSRFSAQTAHSQTVLELPEQAVHLAYSQRDPHHAFRLGNNAWGLQFHPEFAAVITREYICRHRENIARSGQSFESCLNSVTETAHAQTVLSSFAKLCSDSN